MLYQAMRVMMQHVLGTCVAFCYNVLLYLVSSRRMCAHLARILRTPQY